jgi:sulfatase maturation enzyme AslB (radical SAM superfamily)
VTMNLAHLYLSPLEQCNLNCKICYTQKTRAALSQKQLLDFLERYRLHLQSLNLNLETITLCGGEVFLLPWIVQFVNLLNEQNILVEIITNGTINRLQEFKQPNLINLIISLDGLVEDHDANRGQGSFAKTWQFLLEAHQLGFHFEIFSVVFQKNFDQIERFEQYLEKELGFLPTITYHPRKPLDYLANHPISNRIGEVKDFGFLSLAQIKKLASTKKIFPPIKLGCHQIAVMSDGNVYACCEGINPVGKISDKIEQLVTNYQQRIKNPSGFPQDCKGCAESNFICGFTQEYLELQRT